MKKKVVIKSSKQESTSKKQTVRASKMRYIRAAEGDEEDIDIDLDDPDDADGLMDAIDDVADNVDELQDTLDDMDEDDVDIAIDNNIDGHYIAECDKCGAVFISAVIQSMQDIEFVSGTCPHCGKDTEQHLKWVIKAV